MPTPVAVTKLEVKSHGSPDEGRPPAEGAARAREVLDSGLGRSAGGFAVTAQNTGETMVVRTEGDYPLFIPWVTGRSIPIEATAEVRQEGFRSGP